MAEHSDKLIRMAGQMADFFRSQPDRPVPQAVAAHINDSWTYRMRRELIDRLQQDAGADPVLREAATFIELPEG